MSAKTLIADESPTIHKIVAMAFENEGITVEGIGQGNRVLEYMAEFQPDIVLADIHLPGTDGYELCRQIKSSSFESVRVILLTSDFEDIDNGELEISRADDFISKPFKTEEILKIVKS
jgi:DNA-binding response OmpR family regulator